MVKASGQIEQELGQLQQQTESMSDALNVLYEGYLQALVEASKRQLVLAAYYLCTQAYPDRFLALSWDKRNQLQRSLQVLSAKIEGQLAEQRDRAKKMSRRRQQHNGLEFLQRLLESRSSSPDSLDSKGDVDSASQVVDFPKSGDDGLESATEATPKRRLSDAHSNESYTHKLDSAERQSTEFQRDADDSGGVGDSPLESHDEGIGSGALDDSLVIGEGLFDDVKDIAADDGAAPAVSGGDALANGDLAAADLGADDLGVDDLGADIESDGCA